MKLKRYWFTFSGLPQFTPLRIGCGIAAFNPEDALSIVREKVLASHPDVGIESVVENFPLDSLDQGHVVPNMGSLTRRGVWFPLGFE